MTSGTTFFRRFVRIVKSLYRSGCIEFSSVIMPHPVMTLRNVNDSRVEVDSSGLLFTMLTIATVLYICTLRMCSEKMGVQTFLKSSRNGEMQNRERREGGMDHTYLNHLPSTFLSPCLYPSEE